MMPQFPIQNLSVKKFPLFTLKDAWQLMFLPNRTFPSPILLFKTRGRPGFAAPAQGQPAADIPKAYTAAEQHASDPDAALDALAADVGGRKG